MAKIPAADSESQGPVEDVPLDRQRNPFSVCCTKPDAMPFLFPPLESSETVAGRLMKFGGWGQIVGPHGSGKSCLLASLLPVLEKAGIKPVLIELHDQQRRLGIDLDARLRDTPFGVAVIDGYEQLNWWNRLLLKRFCRKHGIGLLVTSHSDAGLPDLFRPEVHVDLAHRLVVRLLGSDAAVISPAEVSDRFAWHHGNLRELFMDLYDLYEARRSDSPSQDA